MNRSTQIRSPLLRATTAALAAALILTTPQVVLAASAQEIDIKVDATLKQFRDEIKGGDNFLSSAKGLLVFPSVFKAGLVIGGEYGQGALRIGGRTVDYYNTAGASFGFQLGAQTKSIVIAFMQQDALDNFRASQGWEAGVDGSVALVELGVGGTLNSNNIRDPIVGFVFSNKGLMYNLTLEGSKFTRLNKGAVAQTAEPAAPEPEAAPPGEEEDSAKTFPLEPAGESDPRVEEDGT